MNNGNWRILGLFSCSSCWELYQTYNIVTVVFVSLNISMRSKKAFDEFYIVNCCTDICVLNYHCACLVFCALLCFVHCCIVQLMWFGEEKNASNGSREKKQRKTKATMGEIHHILRLVRWQQQAERRRTDIDFTKTFEYRHPEHDVL